MKQRKRRAKKIRAWRHRWPRVIWACWAPDLGAYVTAGRLRLPAQVLKGKWTIDAATASDPWCWWEKADRLISLTRTYIPKELE